MRLTLQPARVAARRGGTVERSPDLGFELGRRVKTTSHDILGYALLTSPTLRHALRLLSSYQRLINPAFTLELQHRAGRVDLLYRPAMALSHRAMRVVQETIAVSNHYEFRSLLQRDLPPYDIHFSVERPQHADRYADLAPARVHWGDLLPGLRLSMDAAVLDMPLAMADPRAMQAAEQRCVALMRDARGSPRWSEWCRMMLREAEDTQPTLEQLARFVNLSARTLSRYLEAENSGFRELSLQVRTERARQPAHEGRPVGDPHRLPARLQRRCELHPQLQRTARARRPAHGERAPQGVAFAISLRRARRRSPRAPAGRSRLPAWTRCARPRADWPQRRRRR